RDVFQQQNCAQCHAGTRFTDSALNVFHDIGTIKPSSGQRLGGPLPGLDTPTLSGLWANSPYLHDGSAATLEAAVSAHNGVSLGSADMANLVAFLRQLDDNGNAVPATITWANPAAITYGQALTAAQLNATANTTGIFTYNPPLGTILNAANAQALSVTFAPDNPALFSAASASVLIDVLKAPLTIAAQNKTKVYGSANPALTATYSGFVNGDTAGSLDTPVSLSTSATTGSGVNTYPIVAGGASDANYTITYVNGTLTVTRAALTIRADDKTRPVNQANPPLTATYTGFVNSDTAASLDVPVALSTTATLSSPVGTYPISASGAGDANYAITHIDGMLTVTPAFAVKINFQPAASPVPTGYLPDDGSLFATHGNYAYGWNLKSGNTTYDRNSALSLDQRYDTFNDMKNGRIWEIAVPNGSYSIFMVAGDPDRFDSVYRLNVENVLVVSGTPTTGNRWISGSATVGVTDGRLTVSSGAGANNNKICFIDIAAASGPAPQDITALSDNSVRLGSVARKAKGYVAIRVEGTAAECTIQASSDLTAWRTLGTFPIVNGTVTFRDGTVATQRFYRAQIAP
ncbi:MAG TPA: MBG domain-containing protein, partial [Verrucomicrobiae bacterium]|nr:MBG domain-containing protein [Verrucomicrobiae bacterium]